MDVSINNSALYILEASAAQKDWQALAGIFAACPRIICVLFGRGFLRSSAADKTVADLKCCCCDPARSRFSSYTSEIVRGWKAEEKRRKQEEEKKKADAENIWGPASSFPFVGSLAGPATTATPTPSSSSTGDKRTAIVLPAPREGLYYSDVAGVHKHVVPAGLSKLRERLSRSWHLIVSEWNEDAYKRRRHLVSAYLKARGNSLVAGNDGDESEEGEDDDGGAEGCSDGMMEGDDDEDEH